MNKRLTAVDGIDEKSYTLSMIRDMVRDGDVAKKDLIEGVYAKLSDEVDSTSVVLQLEIACYFDNIGDAQRAVEIALQAVDVAHKLDDTNLLRKAHNTAGLFCSRIYDFEQACFHLERALVIAREIHNEFLEFAALCNIVSTLQVMGLLQDAKQLAFKLSQRADGTEELDYLHLQNAVNGLRLSELMMDVEAANYFSSIARAKINSAGPVSNNWKAYVDSCYALCLLQQGKADQAFALISKAIEEWGSFKNPRVSAILYCAFGACALAAKNEIKIEHSKEVLAGLLGSSKSYALDREDVLRTLVELHSCSPSRKEKKARLLYLRQLRDHIVNVKHKQFYERIQRGSDKVDYTLQQVTGPSYRLPSVIAVATADCDQVSLPEIKLPTIFGNKVQEKALRLSTSSRRNLEQHLRSDDFNVAEDWAVAADFASARLGGHCFEVGTLAGLIASEAGFSSERCMLTEMACRLHDIGKLAVSAEMHRAVNVGALDSYLSVLRHSVVGAKLLDSSSNLVLQLASRVACSHHEWWNGCGLPHGLAGEEIPIEARICSVADAYLVLIHPSQPQVAWKADSAVQQVISMAGVQLDPNLMTSFLVAVEVYNGANVEEGGSGRASQSNSLVLAKQQLMDAVKLVS